MTTEQPEALRLADELCEAIAEYPEPTALEAQAAAELRRQHARITELEAQLAQRFDAADMVTAAAQGFRDGVSSVRAGSEPVAKGLSDPIDALRWGANVAETLLSIGRAIGFGRAQQILGEQWEAAHDCAPRGQMGVTVGKCNPPKLWTQRSQDAYRRGWNDYAAAHPSPPEGMAGWISVDERLPEWAARDDTPCFINGKEVPPTLTSETVLVALKGGSVRTDKLTTIEGKSDGWWHTYGERVIAWQKTPAPHLPASEAKDLT